jgi:uncharacterized protein (DUF3820 family)
MADNTFHFGRHKGKPLSDVPEDYLDWVVQNHGDSRAVSAAQKELDRRASLLVKTEPSKQTAKPGQTSSGGSLFAPGTVSVLIPRGKHKGKQLQDLDDGTVHALWSSWNGIPKLKADPFFAHIVAEKAKRKQQPGRPARSRSAATKKSTATSDRYHYRWMDPLGKEHSIPSDVRMEGRENETAPF